MRPLADSLDSDFVVEADVTSEASLDALFAGIGERWGRLDFVVHAIAFSDKDELTGKYLDTTPRPTSCARSIFPAFPSPMSAAAPRR